MKKPPRKKSSNNRLSPAEWIEAEELYRSGWTQKQISEKYGIRVETVSRHMTAKSVKGGERAEAVREELAAAVAKKQREFAEAKAQRQIDAKDMLYKATNILLATYLREFQGAVSAGRGLAAMQGTAKALKDSLFSLRLGREELYTLLEVDDSKTGADLPSLEVSAMSVEEEEALRARIAPEDDDDEEPISMDDIIRDIEHQVEMAAKND